MDYLIIGGGISGLLSAYYLEQAGCSVCVCDQQQFGRESSWAGGGILSPLFPWQYDNTVTALATWSQQHFPDFLHKIHQASKLDPEYRACGMLVLDQPADDSVKNWAKLARQDYQVWDAQHLKKMQSGLDAGAQSEHLFLPNIGQVRNPRLLATLLQYLENRPKIKLHSGQSIHKIRLNAAEDTVLGVETDKGFIEANNVIVCAGAWTQKLFPQAQVDVQPMRGQMLLFKAVPDLLSTIVLGKNHYLIPRRDGRILIGSTLERVGFDKDITDIARIQLQSFAYDLLPDLQQYPIEHHWAGLRPATAEGIPYIGKHPNIEGLSINAGHFRNGIVLGLASAQLLVNMLLEQDPIIDPEPYKVV